MGTKEEDLLVVKAMDDAIEAVGEHKFSEIIITFDEDGDCIPSCPHCLNNLWDDAKAIDFAYRVNDPYHWEDGQVKISANDEEFGDTLYYRCGSCQAPLSLPSGWTEMWL